MKEISSIPTNHSTIIPDCSSDHPFQQLSDCGLALGPRDGRLMRLIYGFFREHD